MSTRSNRRPANQELALLTEQIRQEITGDPAKFREHLLTMYRLQDPEEQKQGASFKSDGRGFNKYDAEFLTECAKRLSKGFSLEKPAYWRAKQAMSKYAKQLATVALERRERSIEYTPSVSPELAAMGYGSW
jgi:hypothetical protein